VKVIIVGAGPAGLAAAQSASESPASETKTEITLIDDNHATGGQIWRGQPHPSAKASTLLNTRAISASRTELLLDSQVVPFDKLIIATGARELFLPFPGWTLPGVCGAGGLQALAKSGLDLKNKRIVVAGTGPLLLAVASYFKKHGADVPIIAEQTPWSRLIRFAAALPPRKWAEALRLWTPRLSPATWITEAHGRESLESVTVRSGKNSRDIPCDYLAIGYGLVSNTELPHLLEVDPFRLDDFQTTSNPAILCAGEVTGVGGVDLSIIEGHIAGYAATGNLARARALFPQRRRQQRFQSALKNAFPLRPELKHLPKPGTIVCRCEDVTFQELATNSEWREAKIHSRCGMGPCKGRVCGPAVEFLFGWQPDSIRPPLFPAPVAALSMMNDKHE